MVSDVYIEEYHIDGGDFINVGTASTKLKRSLEMMGIPSSLTRRASIVAYEAEMNLVIHAGGGTISCLVSPEKIQIIAEDNGPGIPDIELAMQEGYSTASDAIRELGFGAGMGLSNIKRNTDTLDIISEVGKGTRVQAVILFKSMAGGREIGRGN